MATYVIIEFDPDWAGSDVTLTLDTIAPTVVADLPSSITPGSFVVIPYTTDEAVARAILRDANGTVVELTVTPTQFQANIPLALVGPLSLRVYDDVLNERIVASIPVEGEVETPVEPPSGPLASPPFGPPPARPRPRTMRVRTRVGVNTLLRRIAPGVEVIRRRVEIALRTRVGLAGAGVEVMRTATPVAVLTIPRIDGAGAGSRTVTTGIQVRSQAGRSEHGYDDDFVASLLLMDCL